eukprot:237625-Hanusia_phi.AAC.1
MRKGTGEERGKGRKMRGKGDFKGGGEKKREGNSGSTGGARIFKSSRRTVQTALPPVKLQQGSSDGVGDWLRIQIVQSSRFRAQPVARLDQYHHSLSTTSSFSPSSFSQLLPLNAESAFNRLLLDICLSRPIPSPPPSPAESRPPLD